MSASLRSHITIGQHRADGGGAQAVWVVRCCAPDAADPEDLKRDVARRLLLRRHRAWAAALTFALFIALHAGVVAVLAKFRAPLAVPDEGLRGASQPSDEHSPETFGHGTDGMPLRRQARQRQNDASARCIRGTYVAGRDKPEYSEVQIG